MSRPPCWATWPCDAGLTSSLSANTSVRSFWIHETQCSASHMPRHWRLGDDRRDTVA